MKNQMLCAIAALSLSFDVWGQKKELQFRIESRHQVPIIKEKLVAAQTMGDFSTGFPSNWIKSYESSEISTIHNGTKVTATGKNVIFNKEQKALLKTVKHGDDVDVTIKYKQKSTGKDSNNIRTMHFIVTAMPKFEASFKGGSTMLRQYFEEKAMSKIRKVYKDESKTITVKFTINKQGLPINIKFLESTGQSEIDSMLLETVQKMPKWNPAKDQYGKTQNQDFVVILGGDGC